ncbi:LacI family DNA-binding transcriptional regulator [Butyrivibrio sp. FCS014]|uniref:LacI family DNA-binding transcriptional regulator n=1 Tax=Butyrivibrio sp. FCS014 TaxID=1408304 RepID=UPI0004662912|nr:LacI family DNA-binding transcriptional regulator [Butyrivibrio sp. FCS014]
MVGIKDIASRCGVSPTTVSNVLNNKNNVGQKTRDRVLETARELGYVHKKTEVVAGGSKRNTVAINFSDFDAQFYFDVLHGISDYAVKRDFNLLICTKENFAKYADSESICGCIIMDWSTDDATILSIADKGIPMITLDRQMPHKLIKNMVTGNYESEKTLVEKLVSSGFKSFAFLGGIDSDDNRERYRAFRDVLRDNDISFDRNLLYEGDWTEKSGAAAARLIMLQPRMPQVLVCANDLMAIGAIRKFQENGIRVPDDISVCGFDDVIMSKYLGLTTVCVPNYERGYLAMQALSDIIDGTGNFENFKIGARVKWRKSIRPLI